MRLPNVVLSAGVALALAAASGATMAQNNKAQVEATPIPDAETLVVRAVELVEQGRLDLALATADKGEGAAAQDQILTAIVEALEAAGDPLAALDVAVQLTDLEARRALAARIGATLAAAGPGEAVITAVEADAGATAAEEEPAEDPADAVREVQQALRDLGYDAGPVDGVIGRRTRTAVEAFQTVAGLTADGTISPELREALRAAVADESYIRFGTEAALIGLPFSNRLRGSLRDSDIREAGAAFSFGLEALAPGETVTWRSRANGEITLGERFERDGRPCRRFTHRIRSGELSETANDVVACKQPTLGWLLVE